MRGAENCRSGNAAATLIYAVLDSGASLVSGPDGPDRNERRNAVEIVDVDPAEILDFPAFVGPDDPDFLGHDADSSFRSSVGSRNVLAGFAGWYMRTHDM